MDNRRAFRGESGGDAKVQRAFQLMADYTDQFFSDAQFTMNMYYKCQAGKTADNPAGCKAVIRADRWTQILSLEEEAERGGEAAAVVLPLWGPLCDVLRRVH